MKNRFIKTSIIGMFAIITALYITGCEDSLDLTNPNQPSSDTFWRNGGDAESGLVSIYSGLPTINLYGRMFPGIFRIQRSDIANPFPQPQVNDAGTFTIDSENGRLFEIWAEFYKIISAANQVLARVPDIEMDPTRKNQILGEASFLRGFTYFNLVTNFREVPMPLTEAQSLEDIFLPKSSQTDLWATVESDLRFAKSNLPSDNSLPRGEVGRATWGAATAMLGKAMLYQGKWSEAAAEFQQVINNGGYVLVPNVEDNYSEAGVNNAESVFEIQLDGNANGGWGAAGGNVWRGQAWEPDIAPRGFTSQQSLSVNQWVLDLYLAQQTNGGLEDPRARTTLIWDYPGAMVYQTPFQDAFQGEFLTSVWNRKYLNFENEGSLTPGSWAGDTNNFRVMRFADVLLMYAEAENESNGGSGAALDALNQVRRRVDMPDYVGLNQSELRNAIRDERVRELALEGHRWFDLKRWGILAETFSDASIRSNSGGTYEPKHEFLPLPRQDVDANPNLEQDPLWQ